MTTSGSGLAARLKRARKIVLIVIAVLLAGLLLLLALRFGATAPPTRMTEAEVRGPAVAAPSPEGVTLQDLVYFGAAWQMLNKKPGMAPIALGAGYALARVERTEDGLFFAGTVDRLDRQGRATDVILAFAGAQGVADFIQGHAMARGDVRSEPVYAARLFERIWNDPRYAGARIHVTGHSLGAGYAQFAGTEAIARHGMAAVQARVRIVAFGVPNWGLQAARYFHLRHDVLDPVFTGYTALNDPVITNGGVARVGVSNFMPPFTGLTGFASIANVVAAHWPTTYMRALGLPAWLSAEQKAHSLRTVSAQFITGRSDDPKYTLSGGWPLIIQGSAGSDTLRGTARNDLLAGMGGRDILRGGPGSDRFAFLAAAESGPVPDRADVITDFEPGDRIDLSRMDADRVRAGRQRFTLVRARPFTAPGQIATWTSGEVTWVAGNVDTEAGADFLLAVSGRHRLSQADFMLVPRLSDRGIETYVSGKASVLRSTYSLASSGHLDGPVP